MAAARKERAVAAEMALATEAAVMVAAKVVRAVAAKVASAVAMAPAAMERVVVVVRLCGGAVVALRWRCVCVGGPVVLVVVVCRWVHGV